MSLISSKIKKVFLCKNSKIYKSAKVDIVLSPEFYWVRIFDIPIKSEVQAKKVLPTLFEDILENSNEFSYKLIKLEEEDKYLCFAYKHKDILEAIKNSGLNISLVNSVYFAQTECYEFNSFKIDDNHFFYTEDKILVKSPSSYYEDEVDLQKKLKEIVLSSNKVELKMYNNIFNTKQIATIIVMFVLISVINVYKMFDYKKETSRIEELIALQKSKNDFPKSMIQAKSIISKYKKTFNKEVKKRDALEYIVNNKNLKLESLFLEKDVLNLTFKNKNEQQIKNYLSKKYTILKSHSSSTALNIRIKL